MGAALLVAVKDLRLRLRDRSLIVLGFAAPLALAFVFSIVFGGLDDGERLTFRIGYVDLDGGDLALGLVDMLDGLDATDQFEITAFGDVATARQAIDDADVAAVIVVPDGASTAMATGTPTEMQVIGSVDAPTATTVATSLARGFVTRASTATLGGIVSAATGAIEFDEIGDVVAELSQAPPLVTVGALETDTAQLDLTTTLVAGLSVFFTFFVAGTAVSGILEEREMGTLPRLLASPAPRASILAGKAAAAIAIGIVSLTSLMIASTLVMGASWGDPIGAVILCAAAVLAATGIMSLVGGLAKTTEQAGNLQAIVAVSMAMLGGSFGLIAPAGDSLWGRLSLLTPNAWFLQGLGDIVGGNTLDALPAAAVLVAMALVTGSLAAMFARRVVRA